MSDEPQSEKPLSGWWRPWHPRGVQATMPLPPDPALAFAAINQALDAGWLTAAPGLDAGEEKETVGYVLQGTMERDGESTPFVLLYADNDQLTWSFLKVYLNKATDVAAFEYASKMKLDDLDIYVGNDKPQRGASTKTDRFIKKAPKPFVVVYKKNPKHDPNSEEGKMKPARIFVRWMDQAPAAAPNGQAQESPPQQAQPQGGNNFPGMKKGTDVAQGFVSDEQTARLRALFIDREGNIDELLSYYGISIQNLTWAQKLDSLCKVPAAHYERIKKKLETKPFRETLSA